MNITIEKVLSEDRGYTQRSGNETESSNFGDILVMLEWDGGKWASGIVLFLSLPAKNIKLECICTYCT